MTFNVPRIGPISSMSQFCPPCPPCPIPGPPTGGVACPADQTQIFVGNSSIHSWMIELSGVSNIVAHSITQTLQFGPAYNTGVLTPDTGLFAAMIIAGWVLGQQDSQTNAANTYGSNTLTIDEAVDGGSPAVISPAIIAGHRYLSIPVGGFDTTILTAGGAQNWCGSAIVLQSDGRTPTIIQQAAPVVGGTISFPNPPRAGNIMVAWLGARSDPNIAAPNATWTQLSRVATNNTGLFIRHGRMMWKEVCT